MAQEFQSPNINNLYDAMHSSIRRIGIIQTNLENINTVGFKSINPDSVLFSDTLNDVFRNESQGVLKKTGGKLHLALSKANAFFLVEGASGPERTRDGQFFINKEGKLVDFQDRELVILDQDQRISLADEVSKGRDLEVDKDGVVRINGDYFGRIAVDFEGKKLPGERAFILQGKLEASNVDLQENIVKIMQVKRHIDTIQGMISMELGVDKALVETYGRNV